ncbi:MAG: hypothetical protein AAFU64_20990 [Bacteroidota bacterium]
MVYKKNREKETFYIPRAKDSVVLGGGLMGILLFFLLFMKDQLGETFLENAPLFLLISILVLCLWYQAPAFRLSFQAQEIEWNNINYRADNIKSLEIWDEVLVLHKREQVNVDIPLAYDHRSFELTKEMLQSLKDFARRNRIPIQDHFAYDWEKNEVLN